MPRRSKKKKTDLMTFVPSAPADTGELVVEGLRQNNLKNISLKIPHNEITAIVGPSGSGKSSLAFDTLFAEGRWRFIESLSTYTRLFIERMDRPDLDSIRNIRPAIAIEQKNPVRSSRSTVGTATEINDYLRILYARIGKQHCRGCGKLLTTSDPITASNMLILEHPAKRALIGFALKLDSSSEDAATNAIKGLLEKGFIRALIGGETKDISSEGEPVAEKATKDGVIEVIVDRLVVKEQERKRLTESLECAFGEGEGRAFAILEDGTRHDFSNALTCQECGTECIKPTPLLFSFNHPIGACPECKGFGNLLNYDEEKIIPNKDLSLAHGAIEPWTKPAYRGWYEEFAAYADKYDIDLDTPYSKLGQREIRLLFEGSEDFDGIDGFFEHLETKKYKLHVRVFLSRYKGQFPCTECGGSRLTKEALSVRLAGLNIAELVSLTIEKARCFFIDLELTDFEKEIADEALKQVTLKLEFLNQTGLGYVTLDRLTKTLSGGEAQRVTLTNQLASALSGVLYVLDEPSIGLHPRDIAMLTQQIKKLAARANTVVVVEHDNSIVKSSDYIVELGPGSGAMGGRLVYSGTREKFLKEAKTLTSLYLTGEKSIPIPRWRRKGSDEEIILRGASGNNLKGIDIKIPLRTITCVTGVSGSGKSTAIMDTLYKALAQRMDIKAEKPLGFKALEGTENISAVKLIDQEPIGKTPRSNPITYIGGFDEIRRHYASIRSAVAAGLTAGSFSFNVSGGRCEACKGEGVEKLEMYFLPDVHISCACCGGRRFKTKVLEVTDRGRNIHDVLEMTFDEAYVFFDFIPSLTKKIAVLRDVGLGYLKLGQVATSLSGGEAQRLKIARELSSGEQGQSLYILDEPTTGLHTDDVRRLLSVIGRLVDSGNTAIIIEHNIECIKTADYVIDLGPEGGEKGGRVVAKGTPEQVARAKKSHTGRYLKEALREQ